VRLGIILSLFVIFSVGIIGFSSISSQTVFATEMELMKLLPNDYEQVETDYRSDEAGEKLDALLIKNNQKEGVTIARIDSINDSWNYYKMMEDGNNIIKKSYVNTSNGECFKAYLESSKFAFLCIIDNEYVITTSSEILMKSIITKIDDSIFFSGSLDDDEVTVTITEERESITLSSELGKAVNGGGCLIATATYGSEMAPQVQQLRELRDNQLLQTESGTAFMVTFNDIYYSFSPIIADYERENPYFKEAVKLAITPMISTLSLMENANSESEVLSIGISVIMLNLGMYLGVPAVVIIGIRKRL
jgi:hypothetical protein